MVRGVADCLRHDDANRTIGGWLGVGADAGSSIFAHCLPPLPNRFLLFNFSSCLLTLVAKSSFNSDSGAAPEETLGEVPTRARKGPTNVAAPTTASSVVFALAF